MLSSSTLPGRARRIREMYTSWQSRSCGTMSCSSWKFLQRISRGHPVAVVACFSMVEIWLWRIYNQKSCGEAKHPGLINETSTTQISEGTWTRNCPCLYLAQHLCSDDKNQRSGKETSKLVILFFITTPSDIQANYLEPTLQHTSLYKSRWGNILVVKWWMHLMAKIK